MADYYAILKCDPSASYEDIKMHYQELILKHHPDKTGAEASEEFIKVNEAWNVLKDPVLRKSYDEKLLQDKLNEKLLLYATLNIEELDFNEETQLYSYNCRCGGKYSLFKDDICEETSIVPCDECSFAIQICQNKECTKR